MITSFKVFIFSDKLATCSSFCFSNKYGSPDGVLVLDLYPSNKASLSERYGFLMVEINEYNYDNNKN